jgi:hypothetical protein
MDSDFFQGQMYMGLFIGKTIPGKLGCPNNNKRKKNHLRDKKAWILPLCFSY